MSDFNFGSVDDQDKELGAKAGSYSKFGLNSNVRFSKLAYEPNGGAGKTPLDTFDIIVMIGEREQRRRLFPVSGDLYVKGEEAPQGPDHPDYKATFEAQTKQILAVIVHAIKATGVTQEAINNAFKVPAGSFAEWCKVATSLVPADFASKPIDVFLQYQHKISDGQKMTYPEVPKNMKGGYFLVPHVAPQGTWTATPDNGGLKYVDDQGAEHPFTRNENFMKSTKGTQQGGEVANTTSLENTSAKPTTW